MSVAHGRRCGDGRPEGQDILEIRTTVKYETMDDEECSVRVGGGCPAVDVGQLGMLVVYYQGLHGADVPF